MCKQMIKVSKVSSAEVCMSHVLSAQNTSSKLFKQSIPSNNIFSMIYFHENI